MTFKMNLIRLIALFLLAPGIAVAATTSTPLPSAGTSIVPNDGSSSAILGDLTSRTNLATVAPRSFLDQWKPLGNGQTSSNTNQWAIGTGFPCTLAIELDDEATAVQFVFGSEVATDIYSVNQAVVMPSASYGPVTGVVSGAIPYDYTGTSVAHMLPVSFNNGGVYKPPFAGTPQAFLGNTTGPTGMSVLTVILSSATSGTVTSLPIQTSNTNTLLGSTVVKPRWYVRDGLGCIPANTQITIVGSTTLTIPSSVLSCTMPITTQLFVSPVPLTLSANILANANPQGITSYYSDWVSVPPTLRTDGGIVVGETVTGAGGLGIPANTTATAIGPTGVSLSGTGLTATTTLTQPITFSHTAPTAAKAAGTLTFRLILAKTAIPPHPGETATGTNLPANDIVINAGTSDSFYGLPYADLSAAPTGPITIGSTITFSNVLNTLGTGSGLTTGSTQLNFVSTSARPLMLARINVSVTGSNTVPFYNYGANQILGEQALGLPLYQLFGGHAATDSVNVIGNTTNANAVVKGACPILAVNYQTLHKGTLMVITGDSLMAGKTTISDSANLFRLAASQISTPQHWVGAANWAMSGLAFSDFGFSTISPIQTLNPGIVVAEGFSANSSTQGTDTPQTYASKIYDLINSGALNAVEVIASHPAQQAALPAEFIVSQATSASTNAPLVTTIPVTVNNVPLTDSMGLLQAGTTGNFLKAQSGNVLTLSLSASLQVGDVIFANTFKVNGNVSASTTILTTNGLLPSISLNCALAWSGSPAGVTGTFVQGATTITASQAVTVADSTIGTLTNCRDVNFALSQQSLGMNRQQFANNSAVAFFDYFQSTVDPNNDGYYVDLISTDSGHPDDAGHAMAAKAFLPLLKQITGINASGN